MCIWYRWVTYISLICDATAITLLQLCSNSKISKKVRLKLFICESNGEMSDEISHYYFFIACDMWVESAMTSPIAKDLYQGKSSFNDNFHNSQSSLLCLIYYDVNNCCTFIYLWFFGWVGLVKILFLHFIDS